MFYNLLVYSAVSVSGVQSGYWETAVPQYRYSSTDIAGLEYLYSNTGVSLYPESRVFESGIPIHTANLQKKVVCIMKVAYNSLLLRCFNHFYLAKAQVLVEEDNNFVYL